MYFFRYISSYCMYFSVLFKKVVFQIIIGFFFGELIIKKQKFWRKFFPWNRHDNFTSFSLHNWTKTWKIFSFISGRKFGQFSTTQFRFVSERIFNIFIASFLNYGIYIEFRFRFFDFRFFNFWLTLVIIGARWSGCGRLKL